MIKHPQVTESARTGAEKKSVPFKLILSSRNMWAAIACNFFLMGFMSFTMFLPSYLRAEDAEIFTPDKVVVITTAYSVGLIISRALYATFSKRIKPNRFLIFSCIFTTIVAVGALLLNIWIVWVVAMFLIGLIAGSNYTAKVIISCSQFPEYSGTTIALASISGFVGSMILSPLIGSFADNYGFTYAMFLPLAALICAAILIALIYREDQVPPPQTIPLDAPVVPEAAE